MLDSVPLLLCVCVFFFTCSVLEGLCCHFWTLCIDVASSFHFYPSSAVTRLATLFFLGFKFQAILFFFFFEALNILIDAKRSAKVAHTPEFTLCLRRLRIHSLLEYPS